METETKARVLAVIPARGGSKGIPRKNLAPVGGIPLLGRAIMAARGAGLVDEVVVSTDDEATATVARDYGAIVVERPSEISGDTASSESALLHAAESREKSGSPAAIVVLLQCTAPFTTSADIDGSIRPIMEGRSDSCFAAALFHHFIWDRDDVGSARGVNHSGGKRERRQDLAPQLIEAGSVYAMRLDKLREQGHRFCGRTEIHEVDTARVFEIDTPDELRQAQLIADEIDSVRAHEKLPNPIEAIVFDFDGVFTDDSVYVDQNGNEMVRASRSDGMGIALLRATGIRMLVLSTEENPVVEARCRKLRLPVKQGVGDKLTVLKEWLSTQKADPDRTIYVGNDVNDLPCLEYVGCAVGPANSNRAVLSKLDLQLPSSGGDGAVRTLASWILDRSHGSAISPTR